MAARIATAVRARQASCSEEETAAVAGRWRKKAAASSAWNGARHPCIRE
jgi:hypothetical protein